MEGALYRWLKDILRKGNWQFREGSVPSNFFAASGPTPKTQGTALKVQFTNLDSAGRQTNQNPPQNHGILAAAYESLHKSDLFDQTCEAFIYASNERDKLTGASLRL
jgi:hypothetical protein